MNLKFLPAVSGLAISLFLAGCKTPSASHEAWEYKVISENTYISQLEKSYNQLAKDGWEVLTISTSSQGEGLVPKATTVFRRPRKQ